MTWATSRLGEPAACRTGAGTAGADTRAAVAAILAPHGIFDVPLQHAGAARVRSAGQRARRSGTKPTGLLQSDSNQLYRGAPNRNKHEQFPQAITVQSRFPANWRRLVPAGAGRGRRVLAVDAAAVAAGHGYTALTLTGRQPGATMIGWSGQA